MKYQLMYFSFQTEMELVKWGFDATAIEQQITEHRRFHNSIGDYRWHLDKVKTDLVGDYVYFFF